MLDEYEQRCVDDVAKFGWHAICVAADESGPGFVYSVGLMETLAHPEIIVIGLRRETMHGMIKAMVADIRKGRRFSEPGLYEDIVEGYACRINEVSDDWHSKYVGFSMWHRRHVGKIGSLKVVQCVWPDKQGRFPDDPASPAAFVAHQPILT